MKLGSKEGLRFVAAEVLITAMGILIALAANSAWQNHQDRDSERRSLHEIRTALQDDRVDLIEDLTDYNMRGSAADLILADADSGTAAASVDSAFLLLYHTRKHLSNTAPFQALQASGIKVIQNDSLRLALLNYYSVVNQFVANINAFDGTFATNEMLPYLHLHTRVAMRGTVPSGTQPLDYNALMKDNHFLSLLEEMSRTTEWARRSYGRAITSASNLLAMIDLRIAELE